MTITSPRLGHGPIAYRMWLPLGERQWLTANQRLFWRVRSVRTKEWRTAAADKARLSQVPHIAKALVVAELRFPNNRRRDPGNWAPTAKACVDGLVDAGVFTDDNYRYVTGPDMRIGPVIKGSDTGILLIIWPEVEP